MHLLICSYDLEVGLEHIWYSLHILCHHLTRCAEYFLRTAACLYKWRECAGPRESTITTFICVGGLAVMLGYRFLSPCHR